MPRKKVRDGNFTDAERAIREKLARNEVDEKEGDELVQRGIAEVQESWSDVVRSNRRVQREPKHVEITETGEGTHSRNRKPAIGKPKT